MLNFTEIQAARIETALNAYALANGANEQDLQDSRVSLGGGSALAKHVARIESNGTVFASLSGTTQNVLEAARATAGALAFTVDAHLWGKLDAKVWAVVKAAA